MRDITSVHRHLGFANEKVRELEFALAEAKHKHGKTRIILSLALVATVGIVMYLGYNNMQYGAENRWFVNELTQSENRVTNTLEVLQFKNARIDELETANEALLGVCSPQDAKRAIRATPLPKRGV